jgi:hypothetical protein
VENSNAGADTLRLNNTILSGDDDGSEEPDNSTDLSSRARSENEGARSHFKRPASWGDVILLDSYSTQVLLRRHPKRCVRQAVWEQGVLTRGRQVMALRTRMAQTRYVSAECGTC